MDGFLELLTCLIFQTFLPRFNSLGSEVPLVRFLAILYLSLQFIFKITLHLLETNQKLKSNLKILFMQDST